MLSVILPTFNEAANIEAMIARVSSAVAHIPHEIIVVDDDSPDGTWKIAGRLKAHYPSLKVLRRIRKKGLSSAVVDGFQAAEGGVLAVMDADGQHDAGLLLALAREVEGGAGIAIGSRYVPGGDVGEWDGGRHILSRVATRLAMRIMRRRDSASVSDPMSGFFAVRREVFLTALPKLKPMGFKILLDLLLHVPRGTTVTELPLKFGLRTAGESKLNWRVQWDFLAYLYEVTVGTALPLRPAVFGTVLILLAGPLLVHTWRIRTLYEDRDTRALFLHKLQSVSAEEGWLLSDVTIDLVTAQSAQITHRYRNALSPSMFCSFLLSTENESIICANE